VISGKSTIKNINPAKRTLPLAGGDGGGLRFRLRQAAGSPQFSLFRIAGEPPPWGQKAFFRQPVDVPARDLTPAAARPQGGAGGATARRWSGRSCTTGSTARSAASTTSGWATTRTARRSTR